MLGFFGRKSDHPMADLKSAQALLEDLPKSDALKSLQELATWVESVREQAEFRLDHQLAVLRLLDETARPFERKLMREYFAANTVSKFQENRLWMALYEYLGQAAQAYVNVLARYRNGDKGGPAIKPALPLVAARGICAVAGRLKCAAARYALVDSAMWKYLAEFYSHAETQQYLDEPVLLYSGAGAHTSVRCEFTSVLMWYATSSSTLNRLNMHLAERLTAHLCRDFTVGVQWEAESKFGFDLLHPGQPMRVSEETRPQPGLLFIGVKDIKPHIESLLKALEKNVVPEEINLGGAYDADKVRGVLRYLEDCLTSPPPTRRNVRHNIKVNLHVAHGLSRVMEHTDVGLNFGDDSSTTWEVEDISTGGFRCVLPASRVDGIAIGLLVGIKPEKVDRWGVGIVRRLKRDQQDNLQVGVEVLTNQMTGVGLRERSTDEEQPALWLNSPGDDSGEARLLLSADTYSSSRSLHVRLADKNYLLMPLELLEKGEDYDLARYRKIEEDTSSDAAY